MYPDISWQTVIEAFPEPVDGQMWVRAVCTAEYKDSKGKTQKVELTHWITELTDQQAGQLWTTRIWRNSRSSRCLRPPKRRPVRPYQCRHAAQWVENGLLTTEDDGFLKYNLDLFVESKGKPTAEEKAKQVESIEELAMTLGQNELDETGSKRTPEPTAPTGRLVLRAGLRRWTPARSWTGSREAEVTSLEPPGTEIAV